jgi:hypothetical protein
MCEAVPVGAALKIVRLSRAFWLWVGLGLIVALSSACSSPNTAGSESALRAKMVDAKELGAGWAGIGLYTRTKVPIPCITGRCNGPEPPGHAYEVMDINKITGADFDESIAWFSDPATAFDAIRRNAPGISQEVGFSLLHAPRIGTDQQLGFTYSAPASYNLIYFVEDRGYIGYFTYAGPKSGDAALESAVKRFG